MPVATRCPRALGALALSLALAVVAAPPDASAVPLIGGLGGPAGYGTGNLAPNDDGSSSIIDVSAAFPAGLRFFGMTFRQLYVNNNGNITFGGPLGTFTPNPFPVASQRMIAPWWGDVDTRPDGRPTRNGVYWDIRPGQFTVTWHNVGYYSNHSDLQNDFQMILRSTTACGIGDFDVEFRYNRCEWTTGDASGGTGGFGGTPAQAGFDAGDRVNYFALPGSLMMSVLNLCSTSNVGMPGVWRFRIRGGELPCAGSGDMCTVPMAMGACAAGTIQCRAGAPACIPLSTAVPERCDGVDNDCNGMVDDGMDLCAAGQVCDRGVCSPRCVEGGCFEGQVCTTRGTCVETACETVDCPSGQRCVGGMCRDACAGVYCPDPLVCRAGRCVDACAGMMCDEGNVCEGGTCVLRCQCRPCPTGQVCQADGRCVPGDCVGTTCGAGQICRAGRCVDPCEPPSPDMRACGIGEMCTAGRCVPMSTSTTDAGVRDSGGPIDRDAMSTPDTGANGDAGTGGDAAGGDAAPRSDGGGGFGTNPGTCGCRTAGAPSSAPRGLAALAFGALALALAARRRRR